MWRPSIWLVRVPAIARRAARVAVGLAAGLSTGVAVSVPVGIVGAPAASVAGVAPGAPHAVMVIYEAPVTAPVTDPFRPPRTFAGRGNRGLEYGTAGGEVVRAAAAGEVMFAGAIGSSRYITIRHADGLRTTYSHMRRIDVQVGDRVAQGQAIAVATMNFHFGTRIGSTYLDPAIVLTPPPEERTPARLVAVTLGR